MHSFKKKIKSVIENGIEPIEDGVYNFNNPDTDVELLAKQRSLICEACPLSVIEPIGFLRVKDKSIPYLSDRMCDDCGCTLSYKLRQSKTICDKWL